MPPQASPQPTTPPSPVCLDAINVGPHNDSRVCLFGELYDYFFKHGVGRQWTQRELKEELAYVKTLEEEGWPRSTWSKYW